MEEITYELKRFRKYIEGDILTDENTRLMYATDASAYRELPVAIIRPKNETDIKKIIAFASKHNTSIIPRTAGTSLAGQVVGNGIIVDVSRYMTDIIELNVEEKWVKVQPGVVLDELNKYLAPHGLFFGPETSTSSRCMIGGMVGNNSCGAHSLVYGSTRDHTLEIKAVLSDGSEALFGPVSDEDFYKKCEGKKLENKLYQHTNRMLSLAGNRQEIKQHYPDPILERRNTGYALDLLLDSAPFNDKSEAFNFCKLLAGSEGTLAFSTEIKLNLVPLPPKEKALVCIHMNSLQDAFKANLIALKYKPAAIELMDDIILELTKDNIEQRKNRFFVKDTPKAILIVEFAEDSKEKIDQLAADMEAEMRSVGYGYHFPVVTGQNIKKVWNLRKAGLGVLSNMPGDRKPVPVIEDTAVNPEHLADYMADFQEMLDRYGLNCVYYAHIATGELHLRPILNLKDPGDVELFHTIALETAKLVKKYNGSLSGEHGDGRLRGEFIPLMIGDHNYQLLKEIKQTWDPNNIFNPGKIVDTPKMNTSLRYKPGKKDRDIDTYFDFSATEGVLRAVEKCNGSGDCRKTEIIGGTMCPSYMASREESQTTRARANILREFLTNSKRKNPFDHDEIYDVMDLCLSCKACKSECPSGVDVAKLKAEFLQHYYDSNGVPFRTKVIGNITRINKTGKLFRPITNFMITNAFTARIIKNILGFATERSMPSIQKGNLNKYVKKLETSTENKGLIYLFSDEFTRYNDTDIGIKTIQLLNKLGYKVVIPKHTLSARSYLSKGLLKKARKYIDTNIELLKDIISEKTPLIGIEPSAILGFRDEYPELASDHLKEAARKIAENALMIDEFLAKELQNGKIDSNLFTKEPRKIKLHGHCQQKAIASTDPTKALLSIPENYEVEEIPSGCCGMAGSFGYEKEHYELSMKVGELVLFPEVRKTEEKVIIAAPGTSCRHQIKDGTGRKALHPVEVLLNAIKNE